MENWQTLTIPISLRSKLISSSSSFSSMFTSLDWSSFSTSCSGCTVWSKGCTAWPWLWLSTGVSLFTAFSRIPSRMFSTISSENTSLTTTYIRKLLNTYLTIIRSWGQNYQVLDKSINRATFTVLKYIKFRTREIKNMWKLGKLSDMVPFPIL